jgi:hypothetical protein
MLRNHRITYNESGVKHFYVSGRDKGKRSSTFITMSSTMLGTPNEKNQIYIVYFVCKKYL